MSKGLAAGSKAVHRRIKSNIVESLFKKVAPSAGIKQSVLDKARADAQIIRIGPEPFSVEEPSPYGKIERERVVTEPANNQEEDQVQHFGASMLVSTPASPGADDTEKKMFRAEQMSSQNSKQNGESKMIANIKCLNNIFLKLGPSVDTSQLRSSMVMPKNYSSNQQDKRQRTNGLHLDIGGVQPVVVGKNSLQVTPTNHKAHLKGSQLFDSSKPLPDARKSYKASGTTALEKGSPQVSKLSGLGSQNPQSWAKQSMMAAGIDERPKRLVTAAELANTTSLKQAANKKTPSNARDSSKESKGKATAKNVFIPTTNGNQNLIQVHQVEDLESKSIQVKGMKEIVARSRDNSSKNVTLRGPPENAKKDSKKVTPRDLQQQVISAPAIKVEKHGGARSRKSIVSRENPPSTAATGGEISTFTGGPSSMNQINLVHPPAHIKSHKKVISMNIAPSGSQATQSLALPIQLDPGKPDTASPENTKKIALSKPKEISTIKNHNMSLREDDQPAPSRVRPLLDQVPANSTPRPGDRSGSNSTEYAKSNVSQKLLQKQPGLGRRLNHVVHTPVSQQEVLTPQPSKSKKSLVNTQPSKLTGITSKHGSSSNIAQTNRSQGKSTGRTSQPAPQRGYASAGQGSAEQFQKRRLNSGPNRNSESSIHSNTNGNTPSGLACPPKDPQEKDGKTVRRKFSKPVVPIPSADSEIEIHDYNPNKSKYQSSPLPDSQHKHIPDEAKTEVFKQHHGERTESISPGVSPSPEPRLVSRHGLSQVPPGLPPPKPSSSGIPPKSPHPPEPQTPREKKQETDMNLQVFNHKAKVMQLLKDSLAMEMMPSSQNFYMFIKKIGAGAFGKVYSAISFLTGETVAIKCLEKGMIKTSSAKAKVQREIEIHRMMDSFHIIRLLEVFENDTYIFFVMEYADKGDLLGYVRRKGPLSEEQARDIIVQVVIGLESCKAKNVLHRDVKLDNILLTSDGSSKLCDFGISLVMTPGELVFDQSGTPAYIAPELLKGLGYSGFKADIWNLGITLYTMLTGTIPFKCLDVPQLHALILEGKFDFPEEPQLSAEVRDLIRKVLVLDPDERLSLEEVRQHSWFLPGSFEFAANKATALWEDSKIKSEVKEELETYGFPRKYIDKTIHERTPNLIHACYLMLMLKATKQGLQLTSET